MKRFLWVIAIASMFASLAFGADGKSLQSTATQNLASLFAHLDLKAAGHEAELALTRNPGDPLALLVRMEVAELEARPDVVLDSALRLCRAGSPEELQKIASARVLKYAGNTRSFNAVLGRIKAQALQQNECTTNLRLALVTAAVDGDSGLDIDHTTASAGVLTHWRIAGPFGHYSNSGFDQPWPPEVDRFSHVSYGTLQAEEFFFRDGQVKLPDYLPGSGIYYAGSDIEPPPHHAQEPKPSVLGAPGAGQAQSSVLEIFSPGPYAVFLDGRLLLTHDSRFAASPSADSANLELSPGKHRVVIKFNSDASPFRVVIHPQSKSMHTRRAFDAGPLAIYLAGLTAYLDGDLVGLERITLSDSGPAIQYLRALLLSDTQEQSSDARAAWQALLPAPLARIKLAEISADSDSGDGPLRGIAEGLPDSEAAQDASFQLSRNADSLQQLVALHPSCSHLSQALRYFSDQPRETQKFIGQLANCAPESLSYAKSLSSQGKHKDAAENLLKLLAANPLNRVARRLLIEELLLDGREKEAAEQAMRLHEIAPNSLPYARIAEAPYEALDATSNRAHGFTRQEQFYAPYRRSGLEIVHKSARRRFSGGPSVILLSDKVMEIENDGSLSIYTHRITQLLNKDGIARFGEVLVPRGADLLELRTIKANENSGPPAIIEPELVQQKSTVSMPALEPGDSIEEEFVVHYAEWEDASEEAIEFSLGSFTAPVLYSRFVAITPEALPIQLSWSGGVADPRVEHASGRIVRMWEQNDIAQAAQESDLPLENQLPHITLHTAENTRARLRDELISSTRIGAQVTQVSQSLQQPGSTDYEQARRLHRFVVEKIQPANAEWNANSAEDSLLNFEGSRTATLLALARASGLNAELVLARKIGQACSEAKDESCYSVPLVRFTFTSGRTLDVDPESRAGFGAIAFDLDPAKALRVPLRNDREPAYVSLAPDATREKSVAEADLLLGEDHDLLVDLHVRLGITRGRQVRNVLRAADQRERQIFFDQLAIRIFPGATQITGSSLNLENSEQPLELVLHCHVPQFVHASGPWEVNQIVPALGLTELYARTATREFPLYIDSVLFESATFHLHLSPGFQLRSVPADFKTKNVFGEYSVAFSSRAQEITIRREFRIPAQIVFAKDYARFADFARQVDQAERGRIGLSAAREVANSGLR